MTKANDFVEIINTYFMRFVMKGVDSEKFCKDLVSLRGKEPQDVFAKRLDIKRPTLSLLENGKQMHLKNIIKLNMILIQLLFL